MAAQTLTTTTFNNSPLFHHGPGPVIISGSFNSGATAFGTVGDTLFLCKIPHGAIITDFREDHTNGATALTFQGGLTTGGPSGQATLSAILSSGVMATVNRANVVSNQANTSSGGLIQVSASDTDPNRYGILSMTATTGTQSVSCLVVWQVTYHCRGSF